MLERQPSFLKPDNLAFHFLSLASRCRFLILKLSLYLVICGNLGSCHLSIWRGESWTGGRRHFSLQHYLDIQLLFFDQLLEYAIPPPPLCTSQNIRMAIWPETNFYRTQVSLGSDLWVRFSETESIFVQTKLMTMWFWLMKIKTQ